MQAASLPSGGSVEPAGVVLVQARRGVEQEVPYLVAGDRALPLSMWPDRPVARATSVTEMVENWAWYHADVQALTSLPLTRQRIADTGEALDALHVQAPIQPRRIFCTIGNDRRQAVEAALDAGDPADSADVAERAAAALAQRADSGWPYGLRLRLSVNGAVMHDDTADDMLFGIDRQIAYLSQHTELQPGDVLCTGSPAGFGIHHGRLLRNGDEVQASFSGLGKQHLHCVAEHAGAATGTAGTAAASTTGQLTFHQPSPHQ